MQERERVIVTGLVVFLLLLWLGFLVHVDPRFAGSLPGFAIGLTALLLLLVPAAYSLIKRVPQLKRAITKRVPMRTLLAWHIYSAIIGGILAIVHSGHRFASPLGILLISMTLLVILSGFVGRYLMARISQAIKEKYGLLDQAKREYDRTAEQLHQRPDLAAGVAGFTGFFSRLLAPLMLQRQAVNEEAAALEWRAIQLGEAVADLEYAVETHELFKLWFSRWLRFHIVISIILYLLIAFHVASEIHLGLRWLS